MNGVRRFLASATSSPPKQPESLPSSLLKAIPLSFSSKSNSQSPSLFSSNSPSPQQPEASPNATPSLIVNNKERPKQVSLSQSAAISMPDDPSGSSPSSLKSAFQSSTRSHAVSSPHRSKTLSNSASDMSLIDSSNTRDSDLGWEGYSGNLTTRDELLISLMASEALLECREFNILGTEEVEELKKEHQVLSSRLVAINRKLALETKIRDAAHNLSRVNAAHKTISKQTSEQLEAASGRVETAQKELWRISEKANEVYRRLMEHRAGVLSYSLGNLEKMMSVNTEDSGYDSSNTLMSTVSPFTSPSITAKSRFDGAHLFAGHADAIVPRPKLSADAAMAELAKVEEKLKEVKDQLTAASKRQADMARELSMMRLEKAEVETTLGMDLQASEETIVALEKEIARLKEINSEVQRLRQEKVSWEMERVHLTELMKQSPAKEDLEAGISALQLMTQDFGIGFVSHEPSLLDLLDTVARHLQAMHTKLEETAKDKIEWESTKRKLEDEVHMRSDKQLALTKELQTMDTKLEETVKAKVEWESTKRRLEDDVHMRLDKQLALTKELEEVRKEYDAFRRSPPLLDIRSKPPSHLRTTSTSLASDDDESSLLRITAVLQPIWAILPSPEARATKLGTISNKNFRTGSPILNGSSTTVSSLSELDVRALKALYDIRHHGSGGPSSSPKPDSELFSIEAFAQRVQALINDDKALIERLIRFAQAHDLLKKNAERAQKLAQDGNSAMETYQRQVKILEERNMSLSAQYSAMQKEINVLQDTIERMTADKHVLEGLAAEQADQIQQLMEANNTLSAQTLQLAEDAAQAPEMVRKQMEAQLSDLRKKFEVAEGELLAMKSSEQSQRILLLDELNTMQTENASLRAQLRAAKR